MLDVQAINHIGIRIKDKARSTAFFELLGFTFQTDAGFEQGHPIVMKHPSGVVLNLLGPSNMTDGQNILMDGKEKYAGITHFALTVASLDETKKFLESNAIPITGSFSFGGMSAVFIRDPDRNVIELDAYTAEQSEDRDGFLNHP